MKAAPRILAMLAATLLAGTAVAQAPYEPSAYDEVADTSHNFLGASGGKEVCLACHLEDVSPDDLVINPLWGGGNGKGDFSGTTEAPDSSGFCLECHDGVVAKGFEGYEGEPVKPEKGGTRHPNHPIRIRYPRDTGGAFVVPTPLPQNRQYWSVPNIVGGQLVTPTGPVSTYQDLNVDDPRTLAATVVRTRDGDIHCESCHNPHSNRTPPYLRAMPPDLCLVCHDK